MPVKGKPTVTVDVAIPSLGSFEPTNARERRPGDQRRQVIQENLLGQRTQAERIMVDASRRLCQNRLVSM